MTPQKIPAALPLLLLIALTLTGCIGGEDVEADTASDDAAAAIATSKTGSITGQVITVDLEVLVDVEVGLTNRTGGLELTRTDRQGRYTFNELKPGNYRIQMSDDCCKIKSINVAVAAGNVSQINLQVERLSSTDLRLPYIVSQEWKGFLACGVALGGQSSEACTGADPNHNIRHEFNVSEGLQEMIVAMDWEPSAQSVGGEMRLDMVGFCTQEGNRVRCERYFLMGGQPPLVTHVTNSNANNPEKRFEKINGTEDMRFDVAMAGVSFAYQQAFTVYWHEFYNQGAPAGFQPIPDG